MNATETKHTPGEYGARFEQTQIEVGTGEPGYRWATAVYIITPDGAKLFPPMPEREARQICKREGWPILNQSHAAIKDVK